MPGRRHEVIWRARLNSPTASVPKAASSTERVSVLRIATIHSIGYPGSPLGPPCALEYRARMVSMAATALRVPSLATPAAPPTGHRMPPAL